MARSSYFIFLLFFVQCYSYGQSHYFRHYQVENGLSHNSIISTMQDKKGFLWFGTKDGLNRFDGYTFKIFRNDPADTTSIGSNFVRTLYETEDCIWVGTVQGLYKFKPEKETFQLIHGTQHMDIRGIVEDEKKNIWFIGSLGLFRLQEKDIAMVDSRPITYFNSTSLCRTSDGEIWVSSDKGYLHHYKEETNTFEKVLVVDTTSRYSSPWIEKIFADGNSILIGTQSQGANLYDTKYQRLRKLISSTKDGSELFVRDFLKANDEQLWVATESGLFIGIIPYVSFINLKKNYNDPYALSDNAIYCLGRDEEGGIWAGTYFGGVNYYPVPYTPFTKFFPKIKDNSISGNAVREICEDTEGNLWIGTEDAGLNKFNPQSGKFTRYEPSTEANSLVHYNIHGLVYLDNELWIGTFEHGLDVMDLTTKKVIRHYDASENPGDLKSDFIYSLSKTRNNEILVASSLGLYHYNRHDDNFIPIKTFPENFHYTMVLEDHDDAIWAGTYRDGLYYYNPSTGQSESYTSDPDDSTSLSSNWVNGVFEDSKTNIWVTTESGLNKLDRTTGKFKRYSVENGLPSHVIYCLMEDDKNNLWISTSKGLASFNPSSDKFHVYSKANGLLSDQFNYNSFYKDRDGRMYFGSVNGLIRFNPTEFRRNLFVPPIRITGIQVDNHELAVNKPNSPLNKSITYSDKVELEYDQSNLSIDFAALSYTAPSMTEYMYRMEGLSDNWTYLKANRKVYFTELAPGNYTFEVRASNSSGIWNDESTKLEIVMHPPFWASTYAYLFYGLLCVVLLFILIRYYHKQSERRNFRQIRILEAEKEKEIYQAKIEFFTNVAHEIRTPLSLIYGPLEKVMQYDNFAIDIKNNLLTMKKNTSRLLELANQLLDFRKTEIKQFSLTFVKVEISELIREIYHRFQSAAEQKNLKISLELPATSQFAYVDHEALTKILSNLISNAVKYAAQRTSIHLYPFRDQSDEFFTIVVKNDGDLVPEHLKDKIFEPFFRVNENDSHTGTGIGLPLALSLTELHKGSLEFKVDENQLNMFVLTLPVHQEKEFHLLQEYMSELNKLEDPPKDQVENDDKPSILIVEDNQEMMAFIATDLEAEYYLLKAPDGDKALEILRERNVRLVISDVMMPVMDGFSLCKHIKTNIDFSHIPIILLTAKKSLQAKLEGLESGADAYIEKPFSPEHLRVQITNLLTNRGHIKQYYLNSPLAHIKSMANSKADERFLEKLDQEIVTHIADAELNVDILADLMNMSRPTLYRKIKAVSDLTPNELINVARLKKAAELLAEGDYRIYEVANIVGYNSQTSFGRNFLKQFGMTPSEYASQSSTV